MDLRFRAATQDDLERLLEIHFAAYPNPRTEPERRRNFESNVLGPLDDLHVAEGPDGIVAHAFLFALETCFGGKTVKTGGVASVAVAPEARGRGVASRLLAHLHLKSDVRGDAITMLYPFRQGFYTRLGYAPTTSFRRLEIHPASIPERWRRLAAAHVRRARGEDRDDLARCHARAAARTSGWLLRPGALWERLWSRERRQHLVATSDTGAVVGYVAFTLVQEEAHAETQLVVHELATDGDDARAALLGALGAMRDQVDVITLEVPIDDALEFALVDADRTRHGTEDVEHVVGTIASGPMVRLTDVLRALSARGYGGSGTFDLVVGEGDEELAVGVDIDGGSARIGAARGGPVVRTSRQGLTAILYGGLGLGAAARIGLVEGDARQLARVEPLLAIPPLSPIDPF